MSKKGRGRPKWSPPDGVKRQSPAQANKANASPRPSSHKSPYATMYAQQKRKHTLEKPGYGRTGHLEGF
jgi:hypothetical protein